MIVKVSDLDVRNHSVYQLRSAIQLDSENFNSKISGQVNSWIFVCV
jgi:hypothetical protein